MRWISNKNIGSDSLEERSIHECDITGEDKGKEFNWDDESLLKLIKETKKTLKLYK